MNLNIFVFLKYFYFRDYPGILAGCHVNWVMDWPSDALFGVVSHYLEQQETLNNMNAVTKYVDLLTKYLSQALVKP